eukprot:2205462-Prorocentrum_lima.AAC.1
MDFSCNVNGSLPAHLGTVPTCIPKTILGGDVGNIGRCLHERRFSRDAGISSRMCSTKNGEAIHGGITHPHQ